MKRTYINVLRPRTFLAYLASLPLMFICIALIAAHSCCVLSSARYIPNAHSQKIFQEVRPALARPYASVVEILNVHMLPIGSAVVIDSRAGYHTTILTAYHVIKHLPSTNIMTMSCLSTKVKNGALCELYETHVVAIDQRRDLALLKTDNVLPTPLFYSPIGKRMPKKGETSWVIGNPNSTTRKVTKGLITHFDYNSAGVEVYITDAAIDFGSSGGGMFDIYGKLIGIAHGAYVSQIRITPRLIFPGDIKHGWALFISLKEIRDFLTEKHQNYLLD